MVIIRGRTFAERAPSCRLVEQDMTNRLTWIAAIGAAALTACQEPAPPRPEARPVRTVTVERRAGGEPLVLAGQIRAQDETSLAFRLDGRMIERRANVRDRLKAGQLAARLNLQNQQNALRSAQANLSAAQGQLTQARNTFDRQQTLLERGFTTRAQFDKAQQALQTAQAQVESAQAQLRNAGPVELHRTPRGRDARRPRAKPVDLGREPFEALTKRAT